MATKQATVTPINPTEAPVFNPVKAPTRSDLLAKIKDAGYTGPTSFTATVLRDVVAWLDAGSPKDGNVPKGVLLAVHPDLKPAATTKAPRRTAHQRGFQEAVAAVDGLGDDLKAIRRWVAANTVQDEA